MGKVVCLFLALIFASCSRSVSPEMVQRTGASKSGAILQGKLDAANLEKASESASLVSGEDTKTNLTGSTKRSKVTFEFDNGAAPKVIFVTGGKILKSQIPSDPVKTDHRFSGWGTKQGDRSSIVDLSSYVVEGDVTLYANYKLYHAPVEIEINLNYGGSTVYEADLPRDMRDQFIRFTAYTGDALWYYIQGNEDRMITSPLKGHSKKTMTDFHYYFDHADRYDLNVKPVGNQCDYYDHSDWETPSRSSGVEKNAFRGDYDWRIPDEFAHQTVYFKCYFKRIDETPHPEKDGYHFGDFLKGLAAFFK